MTKEAAWKKYLRFANIVESHIKADALWNAVISPLTVREWKNWNHCILSDGSEWKP